VRFMQENDGCIGGVCRIRRPPRKAGVRVAGGMHVAIFGQLFDVRSRSVAPSRAMEPDGKRARMRNRIQKRFGGLAGRRTGGIGDRARYQTGTCRPWRPRA